MSTPLERRQRVARSRCSQSTDRSGREGPRRPNAARGVRYRRWRRTGSPAVLLGGRVASLTLLLGPQGAVFALEADSVRYQRQQLLRSQPNDRRAAPVDPRRRPRGGPTRRTPRAHRGSRRVAPAARRRRHRRTRRTTRRRCPTAAAPRRGTPSARTPRAPQGGRRSGHVQTCERIVERHDTGVVERDRIGSMAPQRDRHPCRGDVEHCIPRGPMRRSHTTPCGTHSPARTATSQRRHGRCHAPPSSTGRAPASAGAPRPAARRRSTRRR